MSRFVYFLPNSPGCNEEMLAARGLLPRFGGACGLFEHVITPWRDGPAGNGVAVAIGVEPAVYDPATQLWVDCGAYWCGCNAVAKPLPSDLERECGWEGHDAVMLDGNAWRVPLLRKWNAEKLEHVSALPKVLRTVCVDGRMQLRVAVALAHEKLDALAETIWQAFLSRMEYSTELLFATAVSLLSENYRIGAEEIGLLGLLDEKTALSVIEMSIDAPGLRAASDAMNQDGLHFAEMFNDGK